MGRGNGGFVNGRFAEIYFDGEMTADNGLTYGAKIHFNTTDRSNLVTAGYPGRQYIYLKGDWGSMEFGNWIGADSGLNLCLLNCTYKGMGGLDLPYASYAFSPPGAISDVVNPYWFDQSPKATYYTPVIGGFQLGVSYTPSSSRLDFFDTTSTPTKLKDGDFKDVIGYGAQWNGEFGGTNVAFSAVGAQSDERITEDDEVFQGVGYYELQAVVRHAGFQFGGSWWDAGDYNAPQFASQDYQGWGLDAAYAFGPYGVELQYAHSEKNLDRGVYRTSEFDAWALSVGYSVAPGLKWYGEVVGGAWTVNGKEDTSTVGLTGLYLSF